MRITVIGSSSGSPSRENPTSCYLVESESGYRLLLDAGSGALMKLKGLVDFSSIDSVFLTHYHFDHVADAGVMLYDRLIDIQLGRTDRKLEFLGPESSEWRHKLESPYSTFSPFSSSSVLEKGGLRIDFLRTLHPMECYAVRISEKDKSFVYSSDGAYTESLAGFCRNADLLFAECSLSSAIDASSMGHMNTRDMARLLDSACPCKVVLVHTPWYVPSEDLIAELERKNVEVASPARSFVL